MSLRVPLLAGVTPPTAGPFVTNPGTVQVPIACHPEFPVPVSRAARYAIVLRANPELNDMLNVKVSTWPEPVAVEFTPLMVHWLLDTLPEPFSTKLPAKGPPASPASSTRDRVLVGTE